MQRCKDAKMQRCKDAKMQRCKDAKMQRCKDAKMQRCKVVMLMLVFISFGFVSCEGDISDFHENEPVRGENDVVEVVDGIVPIRKKEVSVTLDSLLYNNQDSDLRLRLSTLRSTDSTDSTDNLISDLRELVLQSLEQMSEEEKKEFLNKDEISFTISSGIDPLEKTVYPIDSDDSSAISEEPEEPEEPEESEDLNSLKSSTIRRRSSENGDISFIVDPYLARLQRRGQLKDYFEEICGNIQISGDILNDYYEKEIENIEEETDVEDQLIVPSLLYLSEVMFLLAELDQYNGIEELATTYGLIVDISRIKKDLDYVRSESGNESSGVSATRGSIPKDLNWKSIPNGAILVKHSSDKSGTWISYIAGGLSELFSGGAKYNHAGLYNKALIIKDSGDKLVYSAVGDGTKVQSLNNFIKSSKFAIVYPTNWTSSKAKNAIKYAENIFDFPKEGKVKYFTKKQLTSDYFEFSNKSHNLKGDRVICTKVPYTAWRKAGTSNKLDSGLGYSGFDRGGNLITPDELRNSSKKVTRKIDLVFWSYTTTVYTNRSYLFYEK